MITIVNPEFFSLNTEKVTNEETGRTYYKTAVTTGIEVKDKKTNEKRSRIVTTIYHDTEDYNDSKSVVRSAATKTGGVRVSISANDRNHYNNPIYLVAIPFNGFLDEIKESKQYRIYRGFVISEEKRTIEWAGEKYKKIAYMIVVPSRYLFEDDVYDHVDVIRLVMNSYNIETSEDRSSSNTVKTTNVIEFYPDGKTCTTIESEQVDPVNPDDYRGKPFFPLYRPKPVTHQDKPSNTNNDIESMIENFNKKSLDRQPKYKNNSRKKRH